MRYQFNDRLAQLKRQFRQEAGRVDTRLDELARAVDGRFEKMDEHLGNIQSNLREIRAGLARMEIKFQASDDEAGATRSVLGELRGDLGDFQRTASGRLRLMDERFSKMLEASGSDYEDVKAVLEDVVERLERLEEKEPPAA